MRSWHGGTVVTRGQVSPASVFNSSKPFVHTSARIVLTRAIIMRFAIGLAILLGAGCVTSSDESSLSGASGALSCTHGRDACKIEGSDIGRIGAQVRLDQGTATFVDWIPKAGSPGEYVGFLLEIDGVATSSVRFAVKAGTEVHQGSGDFWKHTGADCHGISNVDFGEGVISDDPSGGDPNCQDPDGCPDGGGGGGGGGDGGGDGPIY